MRTPLLASSGPTTLRASGERWLTGTADARSRVLRRLSVGSDREPSRSRRYGALRLVAACPRERVHGPRDAGAVGYKFVGAVQKIDLPFQPSPSGTALTVIAREENLNAYAVSVGYTPSLASPDRVECAALLTIRGVLQSIHGYPNEEAFWNPRPARRTRSRRVRDPGVRLDRRTECLQPSIVRYRLHNQQWDPTLLHRRQGLICPVPRQVPQSRPLQPRIAKQLPSRTRRSASPPRSVPRALRELSRTLREPPATVPPQSRRSGAGQRPSLAPCRCPRCRVQALTVPGGDPWYRWHLRVS